MEELLLRTVLSAISGQAAQVISEARWMREGFCASILQLDSSICCVTRSANTLLENAQRCQSENASIYASENPTGQRFTVRDLTDEYEYELACNSAYNQLTFPVDGAILSVVVDNKQAGVVNLAENIAKLTRIEQNSKALTRREEHCPEQCQPEFSKPLNIGGRN